MNFRCRVFSTLLLGGVGLMGCRPPAPAEPPPPPASVPVQFKEIAASAGINFVHRHGGTGKKYFVETMCGGACFFDYDNDDRPDLFVVQSGALPGGAGFGGPANRSVLYHNEGGARFVDVTAKAGVGNFRYGQGACAGDFDGDGFLDLYVTNFGANRLYRNNGNGTFTDVTQRAGVACSGYSTSAAFADVDQDGFLDLYVARYVRYRLGSDPACSQAPGLRSYCPPSQFDGELDLLFRNRGDGTFEDITARSGIHDPSGKGLGVLFVDFNDDGRPDLYVANDGTLNRLYANLGDGKFQDVSAEAGVAMGEGAHLSGSMGVDAADCTGSGRFDLFVANFSAEPNDLYVNRGDGTFDLRSTATGLGGPSIPRVGFGTAFLDYDLDGLPDVVVANGHVYDDVAKGTPGLTYAQPSSLYRNLGDHFTEVAAATGPDLVRPRVGRGLALADLEGDGDPDVFIANNNSAPSLLRNDGGNSHHWVRLRLRGKRPNTFAVGAKVVLSAGGRQQLREVRTGTSYMSQHELALLFGLGKATRIDRIEVRWPSGTRQEWRNLGIDQVHTLTEGRQPDA